MVELLPAMNRRPYPTYLSDEQLPLLKPVLPPPYLVGRKRQLGLWGVVNANLYPLCSGCAWRCLRHDFPQWTTESHSTAGVIARRKSTSTRNFAPKLKAETPAQVPRSLMRNL